MKIWEVPLKIVFQDCSLKIWIIYINLFFTILSIYYVKIKHTFYIYFATTVYINTRVVLLNAIILAIFLI